MPCMRWNFVNPADIPEWNSLISKSYNPTIFHSSSWAKVLTESYRYNPKYLTSFHNESIHSVFPLMEVNSILTGKRGVSLPFTDYCPILVNDQSMFKKSWNHIIQYAKKNHWKYIEIRDGIINEFHKSKHNIYFTHDIHLPNNQDDLLTRLRNSTRRNISKARKAHINIQIEKTSDAIKSFYKLHTITRKHHGLPSQPFYFFKKIFEHIVEHDKGFVIIASYRSKVIAGAVFFYFNDHAIYKYGASDPKYLHLRPNNLVMWTAMKWCIFNNIKILNLGRTHPDNKGLLQFKRGWGGIEKYCTYYKYDVTNNCFVNQNTNENRHKNLLSLLPIPLLRAIGLIFYRHVG